MYKSSLLPGKIMEDEFRVVSFKQLLPADPSANRDHDLIQFTANPGGLRTVKAIDVIDISK